MEFEAQMRMLDSAGYRTGYLYRNPNLLRRSPLEMTWGATGTASQRQGDTLNATGFLSDTTVPETSDVDDVTAATEAGVKQMTTLVDCFNL